MAILENYKMEIVGRCQNIYNRIKLTKLKSKCFLMLP